MDVGEHVHWYLTTRCNLDCSYCFKPDSRQTEEAGRIETLAHILAENGVRRVTFGGGEPLLVGALDKALGILKNNGVYTSIHTNGVLLDYGRIDSLNGLVDEIALPIDSMDERVQRMLRGRGFSVTHRQIPEKAKAITGNGIKLGYHTVFTAVNHQGIPELYQALRQTGFSYWGVYEFNDDRARFRVLKRAEHMTDQKDLRKNFYRVKMMEHLRGKFYYTKGCTDCLFALFLLTEEKMKRHRDERVQFVGIHDPKPTYAFLENSGDMLFYRWLSGNERRVAGNVLQDGLPAIMRTLQEIDEKGWEFDETSELEFIDTKMSGPLWTRLYDGSYEYEELEEVKGRFIDDLLHLEELWRERQDMLWNRVDGARTAAPSPSSSH